MPVGDAAQWAAATTNWPTVTVSLPPLAPTGQFAIDPDFFNPPREWIHVEYRRAPGE